MIRYLGVSVAMAFCAHAVSTTNNYDNFSAKVDAAFAPLASEDAPGCTVGVIKDGAFIHRAAYGMASLELNVPLDPSMRFRMASVSKQFTAMAVLLLADDGLINLDADIHTYLPDLHPYSQTVTVRQMLGHVSGMKDYEDIAGSYEGEKNAGGLDLRSPFGRAIRLGNEDYLTIGEFFEAAKQLDLDHQPGVRFRYNNMAYFLLSMLIEKQTGMSLRHFAEQRIFKPLQMTETFFADDPTEIIPNRAQGYAAKEGGGYVFNMTNLFWVGDGGLHTNLDDLLKWDRNFYQPRLGKKPKTLRALMASPTSNRKTEDGELYAYGQFSGSMGGHAYYAHSGGWLGTSTHYVRFEDDRLSLIALCNRLNERPGDRLMGLARDYFAMHD